MGPEAVRRGAARGKSARGTCHGARQARSQGCERDRAAGAHRAQCQARTGVGEARTRSSADEGRGGERSSEWQGVCWVPRTSLGDSTRPAPLSRLTVAQEGKMVQITTRRSNVSWAVTREDFLAEEALPLAFRGKQIALSAMRESAAEWLRMALEAGTTHSDLDTGQALGTDFAKGSSSTSPWQGPLLLTA